MAKKRGTSAFEAALIYRAGGSGGSDGRAAVALQRAVRKVRTPQGRVVGNADSS